MHLRSKKVTSSPKTRTNTDNFHSSNSEPCYDSERNAPSNEVLNKDTSDKRTTEDNFNSSNSQPSNNSDGITQYKEIRKVHHLAR